MTEPKTDTVDTKAATEIEKLKVKIEQLRRLVIDVANERDLVALSLQKMGMGLSSTIDVDAKLKEI